MDTGPSQAARESWKSGGQKKKEIALIAKSYIQRADTKTSQEEPEMKDTTNHVDRQL